MAKTHLKSWEKVLNFLKIEKLLIVIHVLSDFLYLNNKN